MTDALSTPTRRARREISTADMEVGQRAPIILPDDGSEIDRDNVIIPVETHIGGDYVQQLAMAEEPVTILIHKSPEKFAPLTVDCWVNGKGAEVMANGKWVEFGWLPVNKPVTTKRKYVEVLARSKVDSVQTDHGSENDADPENRILTSTSPKAQFNILADANPRGAQWLMALMADR